MRNNGKTAVFVLSHGRSNSIVTIRTLRRQGYSGKVYIVCDSEDDDLENYIAKFGDSVVVFDKSDYEKIDSYDNFTDIRGVVYFARNACFDIAEKLGLDGFLVLDDDYQAFRVSNTGRIISDLDPVIGFYFDAFFSMPENVKTIAFAQSGDFIGGAVSSSAYTVKRKAMNSFFCSPRRRFEFVGRINEDTTTYCALGKIGDIFLTIPIVSLQQKETQQMVGGLTEAYRENGTYWKTAYTVLACPSFCSFDMMGETDFRVHHFVNWAGAVPMILRPTGAPVLNFSEWPIEYTVKFGRVGSYTKFLTEGETLFDYWGV